MSSLSLPSAQIIYTKQKLLEISQNAMKPSLVFIHC